MSRKANPSIIGGFVLGSIILLVIALAVFGSGKVFAHRMRAVASFRGNIQGLSVGAPVDVRGVHVGTVTDIKIYLDVTTMQPRIAVYMEFDPERFQVTQAISAAERKSQEPLKRAIANGLHAKLAMQSLVTGQLLVDLDLDPNEPREVAGLDKSTVEIPTSRSDIEKLKTALAELPLDKIAAEALQVLQHADRLLSSEEIPKVLGSLAAASESLNGLMTTARDNIGPLVSDLHDSGQQVKTTLKSAQDALTEMQKTADTANRFLGSDVREAAHATVGTLGKADKLLTDADGMIAVHSAQRYDLDQALQNLAAASRSMRAFAEDLERRPNAILVGK